ncbi:protein JTB-like isoform X2 [Carcharodon carcharias]|uniref:protein JTB-like isoform X2 n=1 Tax=Carcharodon carcharias TaxID=13397 RepID=UPI001B7DA8F2|nr:protein JTB-like isoform X2 [Carcharodon carcharias]
MLQLAELVYLLVYLCTIWNMFTSFRVCEAIPLQSERNTTSILQPRPCWEKEEFSIIRECTPCSDYEKTVHVECTFTGFVEEVKCTSDHKYRRLHSPPSSPCISESVNPLKLRKLHLSFS